MRKILVLAIIAMALVGMASSANYMYEKSSAKGVGYKNQEIVVQTQTGYNGIKLVEKESGSGNVLVAKYELEVERQLHPTSPANASNPTYGPYNCFPNQGCAIDYINFTKEAEFEYMPISYQTGEYDQKWVEKLCVQNYKIGAVLTEMYTHAEHLQKSTEVKTRWNNGTCAPKCCDGVLEANINSNVIGVAHIGWISREPIANSKGRHNEWGRSVDDFTGVFTIEKFIQLWGNSTCGQISVDWLPCV